MFLDDDDDDDDDDNDSDNDDNDTGNDDALLQCLWMLGTHNAGHSMFLQNLSEI